MTTIAYDRRNGILASDRQLTCGGTPVPVQKIWAVNDILVGFSGVYEQAMIILDWIKDGMNKDDKPDINDCCMILIKDGKCYRYENRLVGYEIKADYWAIGSGADYALGALHAGCSAVEAIRIATKLDVNTGLGVDFLSIADCKTNNKQT